MEFSIRRLYRDSVILLCAALLVLLVASMTLVSFFDQRRDRRQELAMQARMIALDVAGAREHFSMKSLIASAGTNSLLVLGCVYDHSGGVLARFEGASYNRRDNPLPECATINRYEPGLNHLVVHVPIIDPDFPKASGQVVLVSALPSMDWNFGVWLSVAAALALILGAICWRLGERLKRAMLKPIRQIATTAQRVTLYKDYSLRVVPGVLSEVPREIETLTDSFNAMLKEIEDRDSRLTRKTVELEGARRNAEAASVAKSQFLANVSHELRTPLNAIIGFSTMLKDEQFGQLGSPKYKEYARDILDSGRHLLDVINDILDLSKAEAGKLSVKFDSVSLAKVVEKALHIIAGQAHERKIDIYTDMPAKLPRIVADRVRMMQILLNLLSNSVKFTPEGGKIVIRARAEAGKAGVHFFTLEIEDNGIGMDTAEIQKAFSTFNQADAGLNRKYEGAGLGLPLTKRLVELHHGRIRIESTKGQGTTIVIRLTSDPALLD